MIEVIVFLFLLGFPEDDIKGFTKTLAEDVEYELRAKEENREWKKLAFGTAAGISLALPFVLLDETIRTLVRNSDSTTEEIGEILSLPADGVLLVSGLTAGYIISYATEKIKLRKTFMRSFINLTITSAVIQSLKFLGRTRPGFARTPFDFSLPGLKNANRSFPSGHVGAASAVYVTLARACESTTCKIILYSIPPVVAVGRILAEKHWLSDTIGGFMIGASFEIF